MQVERLSGRRVAFVTTVSNTIERFLIPHADRLRGHGTFVGAIAGGITGSDQCRSTFDSIHELPLSRSRFAPLNWLRAARAIRRVVEREGYEIVHVHTPIAALLTRAALRSARRRGRVVIIYTVHGFHFHPHGGRLSNLVSLMLERLAGRWTDLLVVMNEADERAARRHRIVPAEDVFVTPGIGIDLSRWDRAVDPTAVGLIRRELGLDDEAALLVMVAGFWPGKRQKDLVRAVAQLGETRLHVALAGRGDSTEVRALVDSVGLTGRFHFLGFRTDIPELLASAFGSVVTSQREGLPRAVLESMAVGTPVIGTHIRGVSDLLKDGAGLLFPVGDVEALATHIETLFEDPLLGSRLSETAKQRLGDYDLESVLAIYDGIYLEALDRLAARR